MYHRLGRLSASARYTGTNDLAKTHLPLQYVCTSHDLLVREQTALSSEFQDTLTLKYLELGGVNFPVLDLRTTDSRQITPQSQTVLDTLRTPHSRGRIFSSKLFPFLSTSSQQPRNSRREKGAERTTLQEAVLVENSTCKPSQEEESVRGAQGGFSATQMERESRWKGACFI